jgi:hypothetical protein
MAVTAKLYGVPLKNKESGANPIDWDTDTIKVALCTSSYTPNQDTHDFFNDITNEVSGTGYTAGGKTLTASAPSYDTASNEVRMDANDVEWTESTITARYAIVYKSTGTASTSPLIGYVDFGEDKVSSAGLFKIAWAATGVWKETVEP